MGNRTSRKFFQHLTKSENYDEKSKWVFNLLEQDKKPKLLILELCNEYDANLREKYWIDFYSNNELVNSVSGGYAKIGDRELAERLSNWFKNTNHKYKNFWVHNSIAKIIKQNLNKWGNWRRKPRGWLDW